MQLSKINVRDFVNKLRGIPIELDLGKYRKILTKINEYELEAVDDEILKDMSAGLIRRARKGIRTGRGGRPSAFVFPLNLSRSSQI